ncbi:MAG: hypothetical protein JXX14_02675 [Deltaproteobacteria bacterium]|nr:hypothetical protein [Deltaproteobacteria bacterium]
MRSFGYALLLMNSIILVSSLAYAADEDPGDIFDDSSKDDGDSEAAENKSSATSDSNASSGETIMDAETLAPKTDASGRLIDADFISLGGTAAWLERNGLGAHLGFGGYTCMREYCNTTLDVSFVGSISIIPGIYYRLNPNWSLFADITFAHLKTNLRDTNTYDVNDNRGVAFQLLLGPAFHLPVRGWLDLYTSLGFGPIALREKTSSNYKHRWGGIDIEWTIGANFYFWSVGPLKNFSMGPFVKFGFPIWPKVCEVNDGQEACDRPSDMIDQSLFWSDTPLTFQMGLEARYEFSFTGTEEKPVPAEAMQMDDTDAKNKKDDAKSDGNKDKENGDDTKDTDDDSAGDDKDSKSDADADVSAKASISL